MLSYLYFLGYISNLNNIGSAIGSYLLFWAIVIVRNSTVLLSHFSQKPVSFAVNNDLEFPPCGGGLGWGLLFRSEHRVPCREHRRFLLQYIKNLSRNIFLVNNKAEHIFVEPLVGHYKRSLES